MQKERLGGLLVASLFFSALCFLHSFASFAGDNVRQNVKLLCVLRVNYFQTKCARCACVQIKMFGSIFIGVGCFYYKPVQIALWFALRLKKRYTQGKTKNTKPAKQCARIWCRVLLLNCAKKNIFQEIPFFKVMTKKRFWSRVRARGKRNKLVSIYIQIITKEFVLLAHSIAAFFVGRRRRCNCWESFCLHKCSMKKRWDVWIMQKKRETNIVFFCLSFRFRARLSTFRQYLRWK